MIRLSVRSAGMISSVGDSALECWASVRAGIARVGETPLLSRALAPLRMGLVPPGSLPVLPGLDMSPRSTRHRRRLRLACSAVTEASDALGSPCLPVSLVTSGRDDPDGTLLDDLASALGNRVDRGGSLLFAVGSAGVFFALLDAGHRIASGETTAVMVIGVDSMLDPLRLDALQSARRLLVDDAMDGFIPGEGAAALVVSAEVSGAMAMATLAGVGVGDDVFRVEGEHPLTADALTAAVHSALAGATEPVSELWAGLNGESWTAREWAIAARRAHREIAPDAEVWHPAEAFGDPGAALGAMLIALGAIGQHRGRGRSPALAWSASDEGTRGACRIERSRV